MADPQSTITKLLNQEYAEYVRMDSLKQAVRHHRWHNYKQRKNLMERLRRSEQRYRALYAQLLKLGDAAPYSLFQRHVPKRRSGVNVIVDLSLDGLVFSNPAPKIPNGHRIWVRARIEEAHTGDVGVPKTHEMCHITWAFSKRYRPQDTIGAVGRDEYFVSSPLTVTREFLAPTTGSTKKNFFVYVDLYTRVDESSGI